MFWWVVLFAGLGLLMIILAVPMILGIVTPNSVYGFRTKRTLSDPEIWYPANAYAGKWLLAWGVLMMAVAFLLPWLLPDLDEDSYAALFTVIMLGGLSVVVFMCWRYLKKYTESNQQHE